jgi:hypothetical protein
MEQNYFYIWLHFLAWDGVRSLLLRPTKNEKNIASMEQCALKIVNNGLNTSIYSYLETSGGKSSNLYLNVVHFFQCQS